MRFSSTSMLSIELIRSLDRSGTNFNIRITKSPNLGALGKSAPQLVRSTPVRTTSLKPLSTSRFIWSTITPAGTDREFPLPYGMMQKVHRWSQPFCTWTYALLREPKPSIKWPAVSLTDMMSSTFIFSVSNVLLFESCTQVFCCIFSELPITRSTSAIFAKLLGSIWAAQPVTITFALGFSFRSFLTSCFDLRTASAVTAQVFIITASFSPEEVASSRIASVS